MEARLFLISIWCGLYGFVLRRMFRLGESAQNVWVTAAFNSVFWATVGVVLGMLRASYMTGAEFPTGTFIWFAAGGFLFGAALGYWRGRDAEKRERLLRDNLEWADTGFSAILLASVVMFFVIQAFKIPSGSMRMTFVEGDHLFVNKFIYGVPIPFSDAKLFPISDVKRGDVVIFRFPTDDRSSPHYGKDFIKRAVAVAGDVVEIKDKVLFVNGEAPVEPYKEHVESRIFKRRYAINQEAFQRQWESGEFAKFGGNALRDNFGPVTVPDGHVLVLGDNRDRSFDSRFWGPLPVEEIKGKALLLYWPFNRMRLIHS